MQALSVLFITGVSVFQAPSAETARKYVYPCHLLSLNQFMGFFAFHWQTLGAEENIGARPILNFLYARKQFTRGKKGLQQFFVACTTGVGLLDKTQVPQLKWHFWINDKYIFSVSISPAKILYLKFQCAWSLVFLLVNSGNYTVGAELKWGL